MGIKKYSLIIILFLGCLDYSRVQDYLPSFGNSYIDSAILLAQDSDTFAGNGLFESQDLYNGKNLKQIKIQLKKSIIHVGIGVGNDRLAYPATGFFQQSNFPHLNIPTHMLLRAPIITYKSNGMAVIHKLTSTDARGQKYVNNLQIEKETNGKFVALRMQYVPIVKINGDITIVDIKNFQGKYHTSGISGMNPIDQFLYDIKPLPALDKNTAPGEIVYCPGYIYDVDFAKNGTNARFVISKGYGGITDFIPHKDNQSLQQDYKNKVARNNNQILQLGQYDARATQALLAKAKEYADLPKDMSKHIPFLMDTQKGMSGCPLMNSEGKVFASLTAKLEGQFQSKKYSLSLFQKL